jgi:hypothetical protein
VVIKQAMAMPIIVSRIVMFSFGVARSFAFGGNERTNLARVGKNINDVRAVAHHSRSD